MQTDGKLGELPEWYRTLKAAEVLNVPPWELAKRPLVWQEWALAAASAEKHVRDEKAERRERKGSAGNRRRR